MKGSTQDDAVILNLYIVKVLLCLYQSTFDYLSWSILALKG